MKGTIGVVAVTVQFVVEVGKELREFSTGATFWASCSWINGVRIMLVHILCLICDSSFCLQMKHHRLIRCIGKSLFLHFNKMHINASNRWQSEQSFLVGGLLDKKEVQLESLTSIVIQAIRH